MDQLECREIARARRGDFTFSITVPGISADYLRLDFDALVPPNTMVDCELPALVERLAKMPPTTCNRKDTKHGDPVNLVVVGPFETLLSAFVARWDESETITLATCWKTVKSFLLGSQYRYSPVSPLYLFGRSQDVALQRSRRWINERLHLRLWLTPLRYQNEPVWVGQVSRDIGVRFHAQGLEPDDPSHRSRRGRGARLRDRRSAARAARAGRRLRRRLRPATPKTRGTT